MTSKLYVGNLNFSAKDEDLRNLFAKYGTVASASVVMDKRLGRSKGFGFVEMSSGEEAEKALELNGTEFMGRNVIVSAARPQEDRGGGGFGGGRRGGGGGFGGGRRNRYR